MMSREEKARTPTEKDDKIDPTNSKTQSVLEDGRSYRDRQYQRAIISVGLFLCVAWLLGHFQFSFYWMFGVLAFVCLWWRCKIAWLLELVCKDADLEARRERALHNAETVEWLNFILNRWIVYSDESLLLLIKNSLDPLLEASLPSFIGSIEVSDFTLGTRTPYIQHVKAYDSFDDLQKLRATAFSMRAPPKDLMTRPTYRAVLDLDVGLASPDARFVLRIRLGNKGLLGTETDIAVENFQISGKMQLVLQLNRNIAFPHLASLSFCFLEEPQVTFDIRMLKAVQLMDVPLVRQWLNQMVNDTLKLSLVDPDRILIPLCEDPDEVARGAEFACGVLTLTINGGEQGRPTDETYWCVVSLGKQKFNTKEVTSDGPWSDHVSLLVYNLHYDRLTIKIRGKRKLGTKFTITQYDMPLARLYLDTSPEQEKIFEKDTPKGDSLTVQITYTALPLVSIPTEQELGTDENPEEMVKNITDKITADQEDVVSGVLLVVIHCGESLIPMDKNGLSDPYCMVYANRNLVTKTEVVNESLDPVWEAMAEIPVPNVTQMTLSFVVHDKDENALRAVRDDNDDFLGSCNLKLTKESPIILRKELALLYKLRSSVMKTAGKLCVSVVFRPVASVRQSWKPVLPGGFLEGEPIDLTLKDDPKFMEGLLMAERGALSISIYQGRQLVAMDITGKSDPFVTLRTDSQVEKFRSKVQSKTLSPVWNEIATVAMPADGDQVTLDVWDKDALSQEKMGSVIFSTSKIKDLAKDPNVKHWIKLCNTKSGEIQLSFKFITPEECCQIELNNNVIEEVRMEDLDQDYNSQRKSSWKQILKKPRVFGMTGFTKKARSRNARPSITVDYCAEETTQNKAEKTGNNHESALKARAQSLTSSTCSNNELVLSGKEQKTLNDNQAQGAHSSAPHFPENAPRKTPRSNLRSVVSSVKTLNCNSPPGIPDNDDIFSYSMQDENDFDDVDELLATSRNIKAVSRHWKIKGVRKRLRSWRGKKQRSVSESDVVKAIGKENEHADSKELLKAWFDSDDAAEKDTKSPREIKKHNSVGSVGKELPPSLRRQSDSEKLKHRGYSLSECKNKNIPGE